MDRAQRTAIIVDDELFFAARILAGLLKMGWRAERACTARQAVELARELDPDLAIVSLNSPRFDGTEVIRRLKETGARRVVAFKNHTAISEVRAGVLAAGADAVYPNSAVAMRLPALVDALTSANSPGPE